ncbi:MAG: hypothetical protein ACK5KN_14220 [Dysgonomonas sp.]|uniref:hypothetical protein n=1 Tax=Dysgonomonas sp. TaxID=1891233 RepID=UPI003A8AFDE0
MKKLDLAALGVEEMSEVQMQETNGGFLQLIAAGFLAYVAWDVIMNPSDAASAFKEGMDARMQMR